MTILETQALAAVQFLNHDPKLLDEVFPGGCPQPNLHLIFDQPANGLAGRSKLCNWKLFFDAEQAFVLTLAERPIALTSFRAESNCFYIRQIQGVAGATILYQLGRWEHALVRVVERFAYHTDKHGVLIQPAANNNWVEDYQIRLRESGGGPVKGLSPEKARRRYDDVALGLGYEYDADREVYCKRWPFRSAVC